MGAILYGVKAFQQAAASNQPHVLGFATPRTLAADTLFELWNDDTGTAKVFTVELSGRVNVGSTSSPAGLNVYTGTSFQIYVRKNGVAHGITDIAPTDAYGYISPTHPTTGALAIQGLSGGSSALNLYGWSPTDDTTKSQTTVGRINLVAGKKSGTGVAAVGANAALVAIQNSGTTVAILDAEGDFYTWGGHRFVDEAVAHGMTTFYPTNVYGSVEKLQNTDGGLFVGGLTEVTEALGLIGYGTTDNTAKNSGAVAYINVYAAKKSGTTVTSPGANANLFAVRDASAGATKFIVDQDGDLWAGGVILPSDGAAGAPSHAFASDPDTGLYRSGSNELSVALGGTQYFWGNGNGGPTFGLHVVNAPLRMDNPVAEVVCQSAAIATNGQFGFIYMPSCAGVPTGVPGSAWLGTVPFIYDSTNDRIYIYNGGWKKTAALT